jgi:hypothetical protein
MWWEPASDQSAPPLAATKIDYPRIVNLGWHAPPLSIPTAGGWHLLVHHAAAGQGGWGTGTAAY